jgi:hypothetical protein
VIIFDDAIMPHNICNALKLVFKDTFVVTDGEIELEDDMDVVDEEDDELFFLPSQH